jgi:hypothetical protein
VGAGKRERNIGKKKTYNIKKDRDRKVGKI